MNSNPIKLLFDYIKIFSKNLCFVGSATLCSKSEGILSSVVAEEFKFNFKISMAQLDFSQNFLKKKIVKRTRCSLIAFRLIFF